MLVSEVHTARPRSTKDTAALREVNFFSRFSIEMFWNTYAMKTRLPGGPTIVQPIPDLHLAKVSRQLKNIGDLRIPIHLSLKELSELPSMEEFEKIIRVQASEHKQAELPVG